MAGEGVHFKIGNKLPPCNFSFVLSAEVDKVTSPSFVTVNMPIKVSSVLLEMLIAT